QHHVLSSAFALVRTTRAPADAGALAVGTVVSPDQKLIRFPNVVSPISVYLAKIGIIRSATRLAILMSGLIAGPAVSLYGSPTVSPVIDAACASVPLPPCAPSSISFFALSHAPPPAVMEIARKMPVTIVPTSSPPSITYDSAPTMIGMAIGISAGTIIWRIALLVSRSTDAA